MRNLAVNAPPRKALIPIFVLVVIPLIGIGLYVGPNLFDTTPPVLRVSGLEEGKHYRGSHNLKIAAMDEKPGLGMLTVQIDDAPPISLSRAKAESTLWELQTAAFSDGPHRISVAATDKSLHKNQTHYTLRFYIDNTPPKIHVPPETLAVGQGRTLALFLRADEPLSKVEGQLNESIDST